MYILIRLLIIFLILINFNLRNLMYLKIKKINFYLIIEINYKKNISICFLIIKRLCSYH